MIRKVDRLNAQIPGQSGSYDILDHLMNAESRDRDDSEMLIDTIRDLRRYLMLIEAEHRVRLMDRPGGQLQEPNSLDQATRSTVCGSCGRDIDLYRGAALSGWKFQIHMRSDVPMKANDLCNGSNTDVPTNIVITQHIDK